MHLGVDYTCPGRTVKCQAQEFKLEIDVGSTDSFSGLKDGQLSSLSFKSGSSVPLTIGQPLEWNDSPCWREGKRSKCTTGAFRATLSRAEIKELVSMGSDLQGSVVSFGKLWLGGVIPDRLRAVAKSVQ